MSSVPTPPGGPALLVMAKQPLPGQSKTRLTPALTAAQLYGAFLRDVVALARAVPGVTRYLAYAPAQAEGYCARLAPDFGRVAQRGDSLGERLEGGHRPVVAMSSDSPTLPPAHVARAFALLERQEADLVLGPCEDGDYYLIGTNRPHTYLVREVEMSTPRVLAQTVALAEADGLRSALLPCWYDVDTAADLARMQADLRQGVGHVAAASGAWLEQWARPATEAS